MPPSEDLTDEVEAMNSIYGDGTLVLVDGDHSSGSGGDGSGTLANLAIPRSADDVAGASAGDGNGTDGTTGASTAHRMSLRLWFPPAYPACPDPPVVLGVQSVGDKAGHRRPGAAAHDAEQVGAALATAFQEGQVCLFDAVEEFLRQKGEEVEEGVHNEAAADDDRAASPPSPRPSTAQHLTEPPPWVTTEPVVELKSTFLARCAAVRSPAQAAAFIQHLKDTDRRVRTATHNMTAWRIRDEGTGVTYQDCDDDGETAAGGRLLHLMQLMDLWNVVVVVTRWYGGHKLGPRRFALINQAARDAFVQAGLVAVAEPGKKKR
ncbi:impact family protein [Sporothrix schenckii 1099-18]|uniref:Impact N-terminal domain-containing protein n=2 Tax=Sporothrix schenckii TaxID=29908 RepID=U7PXB2_SPOS1|nr:impact family protein [Sporothrix schenckii 1099-18]ERS99100.1 hypothetical protein HMPREF1624_04296 [Sporothrix schenckii ATCC 58251]KJR83239.1 impact family protein [Sporothrix schenckii 1099-18]